MNSILIFIVGVLASNIQAFSLFQKCPPVKPVDNFDAEKYSGKWFEIQRGPALATLYEAFVRCVQAEYRVIDKNNIEVKNGGYILLTNYFYNMTGNAYTTEPGKLGVSFNSFSSGVFSSGGGNITNYIVIDTDYNSYSLVYSCTIKYGFLRTEVGYILSRERTLEKATVEKLLVKIKEISPTLVGYLKPSDQTKCPN